MAPQMPRSRGEGGHLSSSMCAPIGQVCTVTWLSLDLGVGAKRGKAKGAIADSAGGQAFVWPN